LYRAENAEREKPDDDDRPEHAADRTGSLALRDE
jgi:hypothetical protein